MFFKLSEISKHIRTCRREGRGKGCLHSDVMSNEPNEPNESHEPHEPNATNQQNKPNRPIKPNEPN